MYYIKHAQWVRILDKVLASRPRTLSNIRTIIIICACFLRNLCHHNTAIVTVHA